MDYQNTFKAGVLTVADMYAAFQGAFTELAQLYKSTTEPNPAYARMWWADETSGLLKQRNSTNTAWIVRGYLDKPFFGLVPYADNGGGSITPLVVGRNAIINGNGIIQQRSAVTLSATAQYGIDRWAAYGAGTAISAGSFGQSTACPIGRTGYGIALTGATITGAGIAYLRYRMEAKDAIQFINQPATFSCLVHHDVGSAINYTVTINKPTSAADTFSSVTSINSQVTSVPSATGTKLTFTIPNMGACGNGIEILISIACGAVTTKNFYLTEVQLELGSLATDFEYHLTQQELAACQRYFRVLGGNALGESFGTGNGSGANTAACMISFGTSMRKTPAITRSSADSFALMGLGGGPLPCTNLSFGSITPYNATATCTVSTGMAGGQATVLEANGTLQAFIYIDSEL